MNEGTVTTGRKLNIAIYELDAKLNDAGIPHDFWYDSNFHEYRIAYPSRVGCVYSVANPRLVYVDFGDTPLELCKEPYMLIDDDELDELNDDGYVVIAGLTVDETFDRIKKHFNQSSDNGKMRFEDYLGTLQNLFNCINAHDDENYYGTLQILLNCINAHADGVKEKLQATTIHLYGGKSYMETFTFRLDACQNQNNEFVYNSIFDRFPSLKNSRIINMHTDEIMGHIRVEILLEPWISD